MYQKMMAALDHSEMGDRVFQAALDCARSYQAELMLIHVLAPEEGSPLPLPADIDNLYWAPGNELSLEAWRRQWVAYEEDCRQQLVAAAAKANAAGVKTEFRQLPGIAGRTLCKFAQAWAADVIFIGSHGRSGLGELLVGSVSNYVLHHAPCDVLTVKPSQPQADAVQVTGLE